MAICERLFLAELSGSMVSDLYFFINTNYYYMTGIFMTLFLYHVSDVSAEHTQRSRDGFNRTLLVHGQLAPHPLKGFVT